MATKGQKTGMRGVYLAAAELAREGWIVSTTSRSAAGADILITTDDCSRTYSIQVKTIASGGPLFLLGKHVKNTKSPTHIYVLVHIKKKAEVENFDYYVVPSRSISTVAVPANKKWAPNGFVVHKDKIAKYRSNWSQLGNPSA